jgi:hypothetical protein
MYTEPKALFLLPPLLCSRTQHAQWTGGASKPLSTYHGWVPTHVGWMVMHVLANASSPGGLCGDGQKGKREVPTRESGFGLTRKMDF